MSTSVKDALLSAMDAHAVALYAEYAERLQSEDATIDDLRKAVDMHMKRHGIGQNEKADTRVVVDIVFENGAITTASPPVIEVKQDYTDAVIKEVTAATTADVDDVEYHPAELPAPAPIDDYDLDAMFADLIPLEKKNG